MDVERIKAVLHTGTVADVLDSMGIWGVLPSSLRRLTGHQGVFLGRAMTVSWGWVRKPADITEVQRSSWSQVQDFLLKEIVDGRGLVYVAGSPQGMISDFALAGGLSATHFQNIGFEGLVLGGGIRDAHMLRRLHIPVVANGFTPADTQGCYQVTETGTSCVVGNVTVRTGDWVFGDDTGVVVIPAAAAQRVVERALAIEGQEDEVVRRLNAGTHLSRIIDDGGRV